MKTKKFALLIILSMLVTGFAGAGSYIVEDDIYYNPNDKNPVVEKKEKEAQKELQEKAAVKKTLMATSDNHFRDVDEYNRRGESSDMTLEDIAANQKEDYVEYNVVDENGDDGYYLNGFNGSDSDYEYALRIRRFHNPKFVVSVSDPFYSDIYFLDNKFLFFTISHPISNYISLINISIIFTTNITQTAIDIKLLNDLFYFFLHFLTISIIANIYI